MEQTTENRIKELEMRVASLEAKINSLYSFSTIPIEIINALTIRGFLFFDTALDYYGGVSGNRFANIFVKYENKRSLISVQDTLKEFRADPSTDTCTSPAHGYSDGQQVLLYSTGNLPGE